MAQYSNLSFEEQHELLETLHNRYNRPEFIEPDPISIPHSFERLEDREISGFLAATIAWGNRKAIVKSARRMVEMMDNAPFDFTMGASEEDLRPLLRYVHRTFNGGDFQDFVRGLRHIIEEWGSVGGFFEHHYLESGDVRKAISAFRREFFSVPHDKHSEKHLSSIDRGAACKRIAMYMRWFVRRDDRGVDFGQWQRIPMSALYLPLDIHTGRMGRAMGLLQRKQDDWKAVEEITASLREFCPEDPTRYDYSLFGAGITKLFD
jgi:uncharacterized protein (TIGR02757 family)